MENKLELILNRVGVIGNAKTAARMTHKGEVLEWNVSVIDKTGRANAEFDIFAQLNGYWRSLPVATQDKIFAVYVHIKDIFTSVFGSSDQLTAALYEPVAELLSYHDIKEMRHYLDFHETLYIPDSVKEDFRESPDKPGTRDRTYTREDYRWLLAMTISLRSMVPVWGEFIHRTEKEHGATYKEYHAVRLLERSAIVTQMQPFANGIKHPMEKLRLFVESSLPPDKSRAAAIIGGLSSEDFPFWILSLVIVRRLTVGDIVGSDPQASLVPFIYKYIQGKVKGHDNNFIGMVKEKTIEGQGQESENNLSKLEGYKIKQEIPAGDIAIIRHAITAPHRLAQAVIADIDLSLVDLSLASVQALQHEQIQKPQITLLQCVMKTAIPTRGWPHMEKQWVIQGLGVAQAILWWRGYFELAGLLTAIARTGNEAMSLMDTGQRKRIPKEMIEELSLLYPFPRRFGGKSKPGKTPASPAHVAIELLEEEFSAYDSWRLTLPSAWIAQLTGNPNDPWYVVGSEIKTKLAQLFIALAKNQL